MRASNFRFRGHRRLGYSLLEVLVALAILLIGVVGILQFFPPSLRASNEASLKGRAALLAQSKAEEIRRDTDKAGVLIDTIAGLSAPTDPIPFLEDPSLAYRFFSESLRVPDGDPNDPEFAPGVARVIVGYNGEFRPDEKVLYELRFGGGSNFGPTPTPPPGVTPTPTPLPPCTASPPSLIAPPSNVVFTANLNLQITFEWTAVTGATGYEVLVENLDDSAWGLQVASVGGGTTSLTLGPPSVPPYTDGRYIWAVRPNVPGCTAADVQSLGDLFRVDGTLPPTPTPSPTPCAASPPGLVAPPSNERFTGAPGLAINFEWTDLPEAIGFQVLIENLDDSGWGTQTIAVGAGTTSVSVGPPDVPEYTVGRYIWAVRPDVPNCNSDDLQSVGDLFNVD